MSELLLRTSSLISCWNNCFVFVWCLEIIMTCYVKSYLLSKYYLLRGLKRYVYVEVETSWNRFPQFFFADFSQSVFSHEWCKAVTAMCVCGEFPWKLDSNQFSDRLIILVYVRWKLWLTFRGFVPSHWYLKLVSADHN